MNHRRLLIPLIVILLLAVAQLVTAAEPDDRRSLAGAKSVRGLFDINVAEPNRLALYLQVISETRDGLVKQGAKPDLILAFRGQAVKLVSRDREEWGPEQQKVLALTDGIIRDLATKGVRFEACAVATRLFEVNNASLLPEVQLVGNTFISLMAYQNRGYALIPIQ